MPVAKLPSAWFHKGSDINTTVLGEQSMIGSLE